MLVRNGTFYSVTAMVLRARASLVWSTLPVDVSSVGDPLSPLFALAKVPRGEIHTWNKIYYNNIYIYP